MAHLVEVFISPEGRAWMTTCHSDQKLLGYLLDKLITRLQMVQALGELYGADGNHPIKKLEGFENLWETRVRKGRINSRQFFRFTRIGGRRAAVVIDGALKQGDELPRNVMEAANARLDKYEAELAASPAKQATERMP